RQFFEAERPAEDVADDADHFLVGQRLRPGEDDSPAEQVVAGQGQCGDLCQVALVDRRLLEPRVHETDDIAGADLAAPGEQGVDGSPSPTETWPGKAVFWGERVMARTWWPSRASMSGRPTRPVAPVITIMANPSPRANGPHRVTLLRCCLKFR